MGPLLGVGSERAARGGPVRLFRVLFVCESNAAWSIMAEALLNRLGGRRFFAMSAGLAPASGVDPMALEQLQGLQLPTSNCFPKPVSGFMDENPIHLDLVIASVDLQEHGLSRGWTGGPALLHWHIPDPMEFEGSRKGRRNQFRAVCSQLQGRIQLMLALPGEKIGRLAAQAMDEAVGMGSTLRGGPLR